MQYKRIFFCEAQAFFPLLLTYNKEISSKDDKVLFIMPSHSITELTKSVINNFSLELISANEIPEGISCDHVILHSFHDYALSSKRLTSIPHNKVSTYADAFKNDFRHFDIWDNAELISWGWEYTKPEYYSFKKTTCISYEAIKNTISAISEIAFADRKPKLKGDLGSNATILLLRYWGSGHYEFKSGLNIGDACRLYVNEAPGTDIYVKGDSRLQPGQYQQVIDSLTAAGYNVFGLHDLFEEADERLDRMPFEVIAPLFNRLNIKLYLFDSSVGSYLSTFTNFTPVYAPSGLARALFSRNEGASTVLHWNNIFKNINDCNALRTLDQSSVQAPNLRISSPSDDNFSAISGLVSQIREVKHHSAVVTGLIFDELSALNHKVDQILEWQQEANEQLRAIRARVERPNLFIRILQYIGLAKRRPPYEDAKILKNI